MSYLENTRKAREAAYIRKTIDFLKKTPATTLAGQGGAYELLEKRIEELEKDNPETSRARLAAGSLQMRTHSRHKDVHGYNTKNLWCCVAAQIDPDVVDTCFACHKPWPCDKAGLVDEKTK